MRFYTDEECKDWLHGRGLQTPETIPGARREEVKFPQESGQILYLAHWMATSLTCGNEALLWITNPLIFPSCANWHLYYKLRQSYGDHRLWHEAPGHLFLGYETEDLNSFLYLSMLSSWDGDLVIAASDIHASFDHHDYVTFYAGEEESLDYVRQNLLPRFAPPSG